MVSDTRETPTHHPCIAPLLNFMLAMLVSSLDLTMPAPADKSTRHNLPRERLLVPEDILLTRPLGQREEWSCCGRSAH